jgi:hypothetical protein
MSWWQHDNIMRATPLNDTNIEAVLRELLAIRAEMVAEPDVFERRLSGIHPNYRLSASNLLHLFI